MDFIDDFIQEYKNNPCLWKADSANYKNRVKRQEAYMKLIDVAAKHGEHYNVERTKQKINNLRCAFRHQLKKYNELKTKGEKEEPYCPKRKYFESLMFLKDEETRDKRILNNSKIDNSSSEISITSVTRGSNGKNERRLLSTETESASLEIVDGDKQSINGVEDAMQVPNNLFSDICKEIHKENNGTEPEDDITGEETTTTVNISVISDKGIPISQDIEEIAITPIRKDQVFIVDTSTANNPTTISTASTTSSITPHIKQQPSSNNKSRKRSSSFSSQHSNETDTTTPIKTSKSDITLDIENLLSLACKNFQKNTSDHYTSFGEIVAHKLRTMDAKQAIYAEKIISDILYQGQMKYLSTSSIERYSQFDRSPQEQKKAE
ncbi:uncharacterized protein LOC111678056 [Lucilia cuprina]|uniref:uncharacterized protein LOC111678056 n=1 Tax=Lucilia cuprina TaxID=7375 RepID=UPI000C719476|nr:uncharacterized protein LOC111678056 [Lucilia cuprina]KAI8126950.1 hypothetical protein CVS40_2750 [Lucilia cuprina]